MEKVSMIAVGHLCADNVCVVDGFPQENTSKHIEKVDRQAGGGASQAAVAFSRLGGRSGYVGIVGSDMTGTYLLEGLKDENVDTTFMERREGDSAFSFVCVNSQNASRTLINYHQRLGAINFTAEIEDYMKGAKFLHLDGTMYEDAVNAARLARKLGLPVSLDGSSRQKDNRLNRGLAAMADILITNEFYPMQIMEDENRERAMLQMSKWGARILMATLGEKGVLALVDGEFIHFPAYHIEPVDTTGAGDVFHGAYLRGMELGYDMAGCVRFASAVSAMNCLSLGGRRGIPTFSEVQDFMRRNKF
ncbi:MAG: carbohydrate kinase family protein [Spirochaetales bacterium]|nr:carbohydrate kinase family protein [Spirochaetales bacterium]